MDAWQLDILTIPIFYPVIWLWATNIIWFGLMIVVVTIDGCDYAAGGRLRVRRRRHDAGRADGKGLRGSMPSVGAHVAAILLVIFPSSPPSCPH